MQVTYCIFNRDDILLFAFDCFDVDGSGTIDREEAKRLVEMLLSPGKMTVECRYGG